MKEAILAATPVFNDFCGPLNMRDNMSKLDTSSRLRKSDVPGRAAESSDVTRRAREHVLVCLSGSPSNVRVTRTAARLARAFRADFTALFVRGAASSRLSEAGERRLRKNIRLAEKMGACVVHIQGNDIASLIAGYARVSGVSKIVIGRSPTPSRIFGHSQSLVERLAAMAPDIDIYIIPDFSVSSLKRGENNARRGLLRILHESSPHSGKCWIFTAVALALCTLLGLCMHGLGMRDTNNILGFYMLGALCVGIFTKGKKYGVAASVLSVALFDFFFIEPRFSLHVYDADNLVTFGLMLLTALIVSGLTIRMRSQANRNAVKALHMELLLGNGRRLQKAGNEDAILAETANQLVRLFGCDVFVYPAREGKPGRALRFVPDSRRQTGEPGPVLFDKEPGEEKLVAWVIKSGMEAGAGTDTLPDARCLYLPVRGAKGVAAVIAIACAVQRGKEARRSPLSATDKNFIRTFLEECSLVMEKERLMRDYAAIAVKMEQEKLRSDVLRAISHDLRTPLTTICGNAGMLAESGALLDAERRRVLARSIEEDAGALIQMVENLLALTKLEQGGFSLRLEVELLEDVIHEALEMVRRHATGHVLGMRMENGLLMARLEARLIVRVLVNLLDNAVKYSPEGGEVLVSASADGQWVRVEVADTGPGVPDFEKDSVFEMFRTSARKHSDGRRGMGLGLALCRTIIQAHGGRIFIKDNHPCGAVFVFTLPRAESPKLIEAPEREDI